MARLESVWVDACGARRRCRRNPRCDPLLIRGHPCNPWPKCYWQASQASGFSSEHTTAVVSLTVALAMRVAGRERR